MRMTKYNTRNTTSMHDKCVSCDGQGHYYSNNHGVIQLVSCAVCDETGIKE